MEAKKLSAEVSDGELKFAVDLNQDGQPFLVGGLVLSEALQEAIARGEPIEGAKVVEFKIEKSKLRLMLDSDKDGEKLFYLDLDLIESVDDVGSLFKK